MDPPAPRDSAQQSRDAVQESRDAVQGAGDTAQESGTPVRPAATVMLIRDAAPGVEVFVLRRVAAMAFAPGMTVFPGGAVDPVDDDQSVAWTGPDASWWSARLGATPNAARALVVAAVRELFEETGVLLASPPHSGRAGGLTEQARLAIIDRQTTLPAELAAAGLRLRADLLRPWANWITPPGRARRYDTFFFAAALPHGQQAEMLTTEADLGQWRTANELFVARDAGETALMPPTVAMLDDLAGFDSVAEVMSANKVVTPVRVRASDFPGFVVPGPVGTREERTSP